MIILFFTIGVTAMAVLLVISMSGILMENFQFWPPPHKGSWQDQLFWTLFRVMILALVAVCFFDFEGLGNVPLSRQMIGWLLGLVGFGLATVITVQLGWRDAHGEANELITDGWFRWSRNPIYVVSIIGMVGVAVAVNSAYAAVILGMWALMYLLAPFAEEPWLEQSFGKPYHQYKKAVPRFVGWPGKRMSNDE